MLCGDLCFAFSVAGLPLCDGVQRAIMCFSCSLNSIEKGHYVDVE